MRYLPLSDIDRGHMMARIGIVTIDDLFTDVPNEARLAEPVNLPYHASEIEVERTLSRLAARTTTASQVPFFVGAGAYKHHVPATVDHLIQRSEFLTSYTPYQPEITQGTLQYLFEFQTQVALLTGMEIANASMYDGSTGTAEAVQMAMRVTKRKKAVLSGALHPHYRDVVRTALAIGDDTLIEAPPNLSPAEDLASLVDKETACVVVQTPDVFGNVRDLRAIADAAHAAGALLVAVVTEVVSLGALTSPGAMGADIVVCEGQSLGNGLNFGGPYVGLFATRKSLIRQMPGRLCGETVDAAGKRGYVLTLSTREQHIRREKATSNICTNSGLCALAFTIHLTLLGETGLRRLALLNHQAAVLLAQALEAVPGVELTTPAFFNELTIRLPKDAEAIAQAMAARGVLAGVPAARLFGRTAFAERLMIVAATEMTTDQDRAAYVAALREVLA